jgi:hypothetical protein
MGQTGNNGREYSRSEDDDHEWWRVVEVYNRFLMVDWYQITLAQHKQLELFDIPYTSLFSPTQQGDHLCATRFTLDLGIRISAR